MISENAPLAVGDAAPALALLDDTETMRELAAERGRRIVLFFYPKDFTSGCTTEVCEFRDSYAGFDKLDVVVWGVSVLDSASKAKFKAEHGLRFTLLGDEDHQVSERYGTWVEKTKYGKVGMGIERATFVIGPDGAVEHVWRKVKAPGHAATVLEALKSA